MFNDLMENIEWFFNLHDKNKDGYLTKDEVLTLSESLLVGHSHHCRWSVSSCVYSLSSDMRLVTHTWELSVDLCPMLSSMAMLYCQDKKMQTLTTMHRRKLSQTSHI